MPLCMNSNSKLAIIIIIILVQQSQLQSNPYGHPYAFIRLHGNAVIVGFVVATVFSFMHLWITRSSSYHFP